MVDEVKLDDLSDSVMDYADAAVLHPPLAGAHLVPAVTGEGGEVVADAAVQAVPLGRRPVPGERVCEACQSFARIVDSELRGDLASIVNVRRVCAGTSFHRPLRCRVPLL